MALPKLLQKLFQNGGAGDKLNPEIVPEIKKLMLGDHVLELHDDGTLKLDEKLVITSTGGKMTGGINTSVEGIIVGSDDTVGLRISGGTGWNNGASVVVYGKDHASYPGMFRVKAEDGTNEYILLGKPDGTLTWNGNNVITSAGGTFSGALAFDGNVGASVVTRTSNDSYIQIHSSKGWGQGATLELNGSARNTDMKGGFILHVADGTNSCSLTGLPGGGLAWGGKEVERIHAKGAKYIRFVSGLQICWGDCTGGNGITVTFPVAFANSTYLFIPMYQASATSSKAISVSGQTTTTAKIYSDTWSTRWLAVGLWI